LKKYKTFKYQNYKNCFFSVGRYQIGNNLAFQIESEKQGYIADCTVNIANWNYPKDSFVTIKSYSENEGMLKFLKNLGVVTEAYCKVPTGYVCADACIIDLDKLKEYTAVWNG